MPDAAVLFSFGGVDGGPRVEITVAPDGMLAWGTFYSGTDSNGKLIVWNDLQESLMNSGIRAGVLEREIQDILFRFNTGHPAPVQAVIARGKPAQDERPAFLKLEPRFFNHHFEQSADVQIDQKEYSPYVIVKQGELLARAVLPREGSPGFKVDGTEIPAGKKDIKHIKPGSHTLFAHGKVFARIAGRFTLDGDVFDVADTLELDAGVGYGTGNLVFPGSVIIKGVVSDGFRLAAGGAITVKGPLDATEVMCHGDLSCEGGIIGKKPGVVRVGGALRCLYVEHAHVDVLGPMQVTKALLHAQVFANADVTLEDAGRVVASTVWVKNSLRCGQLGGENGPARVVAGSDFVIQRKLEGLRHRHKQLEHEGAAHREEIDALVTEINELTPQLFVNPAAEITVLTKVFEGTVIEMGFATLTVTKPLKGTVFKLSEDGKTIVSQPLSKEATKPAPPTAISSEDSNAEAP